MPRVPLTSSTNRSHLDTDSVTDPTITLRGRNVIPSVWPFGPENITASRLKKRLRIHVWLSLSHSKYSRCGPYGVTVVASQWVRRHQPAAGTILEPLESWMEGRVVLLAIGCSLTRSAITVFKVCLQYMDHHLVLSVWWSTAFLSCKIHLKQWTHHQYVQKSTHTDCCNALPAVRKLQPAYKSLG